MSKKVIKKKAKEHKFIKDKVETLKKVTSPEDNIPVVSQSVFNARKVVSYIILGSLIIAISALTFFAKLRPYFNVDLTITREVQEYNALWFQILMNTLTFIGNPGTSSVVLLLTAGLFYLKKRKKEAAMLVFSTIGAAIISVTMKQYVHRLRPSPTLIHQVTRYLKPDSFPSGHVLFYVGFFGFLFFLTFTLPQSNKFRIILLIVLGLMLSLIGASRIYLGAHWFSDVMGAYLVGLIWLTIVVFIYNRWQPKPKTS